MPILIILLLFSTPAQAYLDPGTGSIIAQAVIAAVLGLVFQWKMLWRRFKQVIQKLFGQHEK